MRPSRFRPALTASLRRQKLNGFFTAIVSPVWRGRTIHGCRSTAAPLQTSRPGGTDWATSREPEIVCELFDRPDITSFLRTWVFVTQIRVIVHLASTSESWTVLPSGVDNLKSGAFSPIAGGAAAAIGSTVANAATVINTRFTRFPL
jgi:hypothetical protein